MRYLIIAALLFNAMTACAQKTISNVLGNIPSEIVPYIGVSQREEINEFLTTSDTLEISNELNGTTTIYKMNENFAVIDLNEAVRLKIKLLSLSDTAQAVCLVKTITSPIAESHVAFYSTDWILLDTSFNLPDFGDIDYAQEQLISRPDTMTEERFNELRRYIEPVIVKADIEEEVDVISFTLGVPFTTKEEADAVNAIIRQKSFKWDGKSFKNC